MGHQADNDAVPTALPHEPTTLVDSSPIPVEVEVTTVWVRDWAVMQEIKGESTIRIQPPHSMETMRVVTKVVEAAPEAIEDPLEAPFLALCRLVHLAEIYGWNDPGADKTLDGPIDAEKPSIGRGHSARATTAPYDGGRIGEEIDVMRADPTGLGRWTAIRLTCNDWPEFKEWFRKRQKETFKDLWPLASEHREFLYQFGDTLDHHQPAADGRHILIDITNL